MITLRKRILTAGTPAILGTVILAGSLTAFELLGGQSAGAQTAGPDVQQTAEQTQIETGKGDLKVDLADVSGRPTRCVTGYRKTTCTGWPVTSGMLAYRTE